jgi:hypothetical protein
LKIAINISKSTANIFALVEMRFIKARSVTLFGEPIQCLETTRYLGVTLEKLLLWSSHIDQVRKKTSKRMDMKDPS